MKKIYADYNRIFLDNWNGALGNKILHIYFLINLCNRYNRKPVMYKGSNLDNLFNFNFEVLENKPLIKSYFYQEPDIFYIQNDFLNIIGKQFFFKDRYSSIDKMVLKSYKLYLERKNFFEDAKLPVKDIMISGHFWEYSLMPSQNILDEYLLIKPELVSYITQTYPTIKNENNIAVHYRGTDFNHHLRHVFKKGIMVDRTYYKKAMNIVENELGKNVIYHLFSDDLNTLKEYFEGKNVILHKDNSFYDWVSLNLAKNVIQSNSSFCWTACLFNKGINIQPKDGYNYYSSNGSIPFDFGHKNSLLI